MSDAANDGQKMQQRLVEYPFYGEPKRPYVLNK